VKSTLSHEKRHPEPITWPRPTEKGRQTAYIVNAPMLPRRMGEPLMYHLFRAVWDKVAAWRSVDARGAIIEPGPTNSRTRLIPRYRPIATLALTNSAELLSPVRRARHLWQPALDCLCQQLDINVLEKHLLLPPFPVSTPGLDWLSVINTRPDRSTVSTSNLRRLHMTFL